MIDRICISINNRCNLSCKYCHFHDKRFFEDAEMNDYIRSPKHSTEEYYQHVIAEKFANEKRLIVSTLRQHGIYSVLTTPDKLSIDVINKYLEMKQRQILTQ